MKRSYIISLLLFPVLAEAQQKKDSTKTVYLKEVTVTGIKNVRGTGHMPEVKDGVIYAG